MKKSREPLPRSPLYQTQTAGSPKSSPDLRSSGPGTPLRVSSLRHQFSEGSMPHTNGEYDRSPPAQQGTMSVQRRNLPPYARPQGSEGMFGEDYFAHELQKVSSSATEAALSDAPSPLAHFGTWDKQLDWQVALDRGWGMGHTGTGNNMELKRKLRERADKELRNGTRIFLTGPPPKPVVPPTIPAKPRLDIVLPAELQGLRTPRSASAARGRSFHVPHHFNMAQQQSYGLLDGSSSQGHGRVPSSQQYAPSAHMVPQPQFAPINQLSPIGQLSHNNQYAIVPSYPAQSYAPVTQIVPVSQYGPIRQFSPGGLIQPASHFNQHRQHSPAGHFGSHGHHNQVRQTQTQHRNQPHRQTTPVRHMSSGSPFSRSASSYSDMMSNTSSTRYTEEAAQYSPPNNAPIAPRAMMPAQSVYVPRSRPVSTPRSANSYERNNEFMVRTSYGQGAPLQRPTPPPAIGHGRPRSSESLNVPRQLPQWQRNQENSEEAAMSVLQSGMERVRVEEQSRERDGDVMNNTPPHESIMERFLREE